MIPLFIHILVNGDVWVSSNMAFTPATAIAATFRVSSLARSQKIGTISGSAGAFASTGHTGKSGKDFA